MRLPVLVSLLSVAALLIAAYSCQRLPQHTDVDVDAITAPELWARVFAANEVWLVPSSNGLSYVATYRAVDSKSGTPNASSRVSIRDGGARWEMDVFNVNDASVTASYVLAIEGQEERYLKAPHIQMTHKPRKARDMRTLRQGMQLSTAVHALAAQGLPAGASIVERRPKMLVLETDLQARRCDIGLGLYHFFLGRQSFSMGKVRIYIKIPELIPVREEFLGNNSYVEYEQFETIADHVAPMRIRQVSNRTSRQGDWSVQLVFDCRFQKVRNSWLSERAVNIQNGRVFAEMTVTAVPSDGEKDDQFRLSHHEAF